MNGAPNSMWSEPVPAIPQYGKRFIDACAVQDPHIIWDRTAGVIQWESRTIKLKDPSPS
jgi:hypothetical protein